MNNNILLDELIEINNNLIVDVVNLHSSFETQIKELELKILELKLQIINIKEVNEFISSN